MSDSEEKKLPAVSKAFNVVRNIAQAVGPFIVSQSDVASEAFARHKSRLAQVEVWKVAITGEIGELTELRAKLRQRYYDAGPEDRIRIKADREELEKEVRRLSVFQKALDHAPNAQCPEEQPSISLKNENSQIAPMWIDRFNEYARLQNESWRQDILARALAREAERPGSVGPRALWFIGTMDELTFHAFASIVDISTNTSTGRFVPDAGSYLNRVIPGFPLSSTIKLGNLTFLLSELGLIGSALGTALEMPAQKSQTVSHGSATYLVKPSIHLQVPATVFTALGNTVALLYDQRPNQVGVEIFDAWIKSLNPKVVQVTKVDDVSDDFASPAASAT